MSIVPTIWTMYPQKNIGHLREPFHQLSGLIDRTEHHHTMTTIRQAQLEFSLPSRLAEMEVVERYMSRMNFGTRIARQETLREPHQFTSTILILFRSYIQIKYAKLPCLLDSRDALLTFIGLLIRKRIATSTLFVVSRTTTQILPYLYQSKQLA
jgi:hypothetical protein